MKLITNLWYRLLLKKAIKEDQNEREGFTLVRMHRSIDQIKDQLEKVVQDQFAKSHLDECRRLEDRITSVLMEWEKIINQINERLNKLETK